VGNPLLRDALQYATSGWRVFPLHTPTPDGCSCGKSKCQNAGKHPRTATGLKEASADEATIRGWWTRWPEANIGIVTGTETGLCVLDVDGEHGQASLLALESPESFPKTLRSLTGRRGSNGERTGAHLYFTLSPGAKLRNSAGLLGKGLDIRAAGGYVVAPPSLHASGLRYEWDGDGNTIADLPAWLIAKASKPTLAAVSSPHNIIREGQRNSTLTSRAGSMRKSGMATSSIEAAMQEENRKRCRPPLAEEEVSRIIASIERYPRGTPGMRKTRRAEVVCLADVQAEEVEWLWEPYIPLKMITLLSGDPGVGKTFLSLALAAALTRGRAMLTGAEIVPGNVLYLTQENSLSHVLRPRFDTLCGDPHRFFSLRGTLYEDGSSGGIALEDIEQLEEAVTKHKARLVVIDPLQSFLGGNVDAHRANETRPILDGIGKLAEKTGCAILITRHLSKGIGGNALHRGLGSIDITGAARSELLVAADPEQEGRVVMAHSKSNLGKFGPSVGYSIDDAGKLQWHGESRLKANELLTAPVSSAERSAVDDAEDFLREALAEGPRPVKEMQRIAVENGISIATLRRAQLRLQVAKGPQGFKGAWMLSLPVLLKNLHSCSSLHLEQHCISMNNTGRIWYGEHEHGTSSGVG
jgi:Bifunctional DNA primase/polymerase, N-terminal/AAA domain/Primase C terminal 1 (PriCT-1)